MLLFDTERDKRSKSKLPRKEKDMTAINRLCQLHSECELSALLKGYEWSFDTMRSFKAKHKRENCVSRIVTRPGR